MTNRVDELESQVETLQATVDGLTEELVEAKERLRLLEESVDVDLTAGSRAVGHAAETPADEAAATDDTQNPNAESPAQSASRSQTSDSPSDDVSFVDSEADATEVSRDDDGTKTDGHEDDDEAATDEDDIIVA